MAKRNMTDTKIRTLIKAYLVFHRGRKCSGDEISEWINNNGFGLNQRSVEPKTISHHIRSGMYEMGHILYGVNIEKINYRNHYWIE